MIRSFAISNEGRDDVDVDDEDDEDDDDDDLRLCR